VDIKIGSVVKGTAGREKGRYFVAVDAHDGFVYIADGKERKLSAPKKKNIKHISPVDACINTDGLTDKKLRQLTRSYLTQADCQKDQ
jgi:ribosomal protein L14E/L6E/L27E